MCIDADALCNIKRASRHNKPSTGLLVQLGTYGWLGDGCHRLRSRQHCVVTMMWHQLVLTKYLHATFTCQR